MKMADWTVPDQTFLANSGASWCTATQLYPMLHYGSQSLMYRRKSTRVRRRFSECLWRIFSFCCGHAQTLVALLIATAIIFAFDNWPGDIIMDYFTLECRSSTLIETDLVDYTCRHIWLLRFTVLGSIVTIIRYIDGLKSGCKHFSDELSSVNIFTLMGCVHSLHVKKNISISSIESGSTMKEPSATFAMTVILKLLLLLAGDVESNPGPEGQLSPDDLALVYGEVMSARSKWFNIGLGLGLKMSDLNIINRGYNGDVGRCLIECLEAWLINSHQPPTWSTMVTALRSRPVGFADLADVIEEKYIIKRGQLSPDDLALVYEEVMSARSKWYIIGLELGLKVDGLEIIEVNNLYSNKSCLMECLQVWLRGSRPPPTWSAMVTALRSPTVGFEDLADVIEKKYRIKRGNTEGQLSPDDLALVYGEVMSARSNWFNFGLELGLEVYELKEIERDNPHSTDRCFINCLEMWLRGSHQPPTWSAVVEALRSPTVGHDGLADRIEEKYIMTEDTPKYSVESNLPLSQSNDQIFEEALKKGYVLLNISKVVTSGAAGSGKTCTKYVLLREKPPDPLERTSTSLFDISKVFRDISRELVATDKVARWFRVSYSLLNTMIAKAIKKGVKHEGVLHEETFDSRESELYVHQSGVQHEGAEQEQKSSESELYRVHQSGPAFSKFPTKRKEPTHVAVTSDVTTRQDILQLMEEHTGSDELMRLHWIYFIDSGGQPQFHDLLSAFVKNKSAILLVIKLSERLNEKPTIQYYRNGKMCGGYVSRSTNRQILQCYCRTLVSGNKDCRVLIIGTHRDCPCEETIEKDRILEDLLKPLGNNLVKQSSQEGKVLFPLNARNPLEDDEKMADKIRRKITEENCSQQFKVPIAWFLLEQDIQQLDKGVISMQDCVDLASELKMNRQALKAALEYFDKLNILLFFPGVLPDVVFANSQVIVDKVTEIVEYSFYLRGLKKKNSERQQWSDFVKYGIISREMLTELFPKHFVGNLFNVDKLLHLFQHLLIIAQLNYHDFIMPAVLPEIRAEKLNRWKPPSLTPVLIYFPDGCAPGGAFCCLSVYLISKCGWQVANIFYRNYLEFQLRNYPENVTITLIDRFEYFQVYVKGPPTLIRSICKWVVTSISTGLDKACVALNYDSIDHQIAIPCPCKKTEAEHAATIDKQYWTCTKELDICGKMSEEFSPWHLLQEDQVNVSMEAEERGKSDKIYQKTHEDSGSYLWKIGALFALSVFFISVVPALYQLIYSGWSTALSEGLQNSSSINSVPSSTYAFHLPGMHLIHCETITLQRSTELHTIGWERFGFKLHIPPGSFSEDKLNITLGVSLSGNFDFPLNTTLVSAVYYIESSSKLLQPVTLEIEHCVLTENKENVRALSFASAAIHPGYPQYKFHSVSEGIFSNTNTWGSVQVSSFSLFSIMLSRITDFLKPAPIGYSAQVYQMKPSGDIFNIRLVVTRHLSSCKEAVQTRYCEDPWSLKKDFHFHFTGDDEQVLSLEMQDAGFENDGWWIKPSSPPPEIHQRNIDSFGAASTPYDPAHCELTILWIDKTSAPRSLLKDIMMKGVSKRSFEVTLSYSDLEGIKGHSEHESTPDEVHVSPCEVHVTNPTVIDDIRLLLRAVKAIGEWDLLCTYLKVDDGVLNPLKKSSRDTEILKKTECLNAYIKSAKASWEEVVIVVAQYPISNIGTAQEIAKHNLKGVNKDRILNSLDKCKSADDINITIVY